MGRKAKFDVKSLEIGEKLPFPKNKRKWIWQYLGNFNKSNPDKKFDFIEDGTDGSFGGPGIFIVRVK
jgi:hypothetical protein